MRKVVSRNGMVMLSHDEIRRMVRDIEHSFPGWVWSISQRLTNLTITLIPGMNSPFEGDRKLLATKEGDAGFITHFGPVPLNDDLPFGFIEPLLEHLIYRLDSIRGFEKKSDRISAITGINLTSRKNYRLQSRDGLAELGKMYHDFLASLPMFEQENGHVISEVYLGSCDLSVDCSIRGKRGDGSEFDVTVDLINDATLADSLHWTIAELKSDILTPRCENVSKSPAIQ